MHYQPTTNFIDSNGIDLGKKLVTKDYLLSVYGSVLESASATGLTVSPGLWLWGLGYSGQLGKGTSVYTNPTPAQTSAGGTNWKQVSCGGYHTAAIKTNGELWTWGSGADGKLGLGNGYTRYTPAQVGTATNWKQVSCGSYHTLAIKTDGTLWAWGNGSNGMLGLNSTTNRFAPVQVGTATNWKQVTGGSSESAAIKTDGTLWTWGYNYYGQLGIGALGDKLTPVTTFLGGTNWKHVDAGVAHMVAVKTDGTLWTWGYNPNGALGINNTTIKNTPVTTFLGGTDWKEGSAGLYGTAGIKTDGTLWLWGSNSQGQLGISNTTQKNTPVTTFLGGNNWKQVSLGSVTTMALKVDGTLWTWGFNGYGRLGANINSNGGNRLTPVTVFSGQFSWKSVANLCRSFHCAAIRSVNEI
jgi:alpha-tubulin suppressor-like RCC1 family protein